MLILLYKLFYNITTCKVQILKKIINLKPHIFIIFFKYLSPLHIVCLAKKSFILFIFFNFFRKNWDVMNFWNFVIFKNELMRVMRIQPLFFIDVCNDNENNEPNKYLIIWHFEKWRFSIIWQGIKLTDLHVIQIVFIKIWITLYCLYLFLFFLFNFICVLNFFIIFNFIFCHFQFL